MRRAWTHFVAVQWQITHFDVVAKIISKEADVVASKDGGLRLSKEQLNWQFVHQFSFGKVMAAVKDEAPTLMRVLMAALTEETRGQFGNRDSRVGVICRALF